MMMPYRMAGLQKVLTGKRIPAAALAREVLQSRDVPCQRCGWYQTLMQANVSGPSCFPQDNSSYAH